MDQKQRKIVSIFKKYGAIDRKSSQTLNTLNIKDVDTVKQMVRSGVLTGCSGSKYYLNSYLIDKKNSDKLKWVQIVIGIILVIILIVLFTL